MSCQDNSIIDITNNVLKSINNIVSQFQNNPYDFLYESDLQSALFSEMRNLISESFSISGSVNRQSKYKMRLVYSEYYKKIDLVCIDPSQKDSFNRETYKGYDTYIYNLPILVAIELKYGVMGYKKSIADSQRDYEKLRHCNKGNIKHLMAICFLQESEYMKTYRDDLENNKYIYKECHKGICDFDKIYCASPDKILKIEPKLPSPRTPV